MLALFKPIFVHFWYEITTDIYRPISLYESQFYTPTLVFINSNFKILSSSDPPMPMIQTLYRQAFLFCTQYDITNSFVYEFFTSLANLVLNCTFCHPMLLEITCGTILPTNYAIIQWFGSPWPQNTSKFPQLHKWKSTLKF